MSTKTVFFALMAAVVASTSVAMTIQNGTDEVIKSDPNNYIDTYMSSWAFSEDVVAWFDHRVDWGNTEVRGTHLSDPVHTELLYDPNTFSSNEISMDYPLAAYTYYAPGGYYSSAIRLADLSDEQAVTIWELVPPSSYPYNLSVDGTYLSCLDSGEFEGLYLIDISDPSDPNVFLIANVSGDAGNMSANDTAHDGKYLSWCCEGYEKETGSYQGYLFVADITDPNNPQIASNYIPYNGQNEWSYNNFNSIDASGDWLVGLGNIDDAYGIFGIQHYADPDPNNWNIIKIWSSPCSAEAGLYPSEPRIDGNIVVWTLEGSGGYYDAVDCKDCAKASSGLKTSGSHLMGAYLTDSGHAVTSILKSAGENTIYYSAEISGTNVVWSSYYYDTSNEVGCNMYNSGSIELECGDTGFKHGDVNKDCNVNMLDLAIMAQSWLVCTMPETVGCGEGDIFEDLY